MGPKAVNVPCINIYLSIYLSCIYLSFYLYLSARPHSSVGSIQDLRKGGRWFESWGHDNHYDRINSSLTAVHSFDNGYVEKQPVAWEEYCVEYWLKVFQESMERCTGCCNTEILLKTIYVVYLPLNSFLNDKFWKLPNWKSLQTERWQFQIWWKWQNVLQMGINHCEKRRNCS